MVLPLLAAGVRLALGATRVATAARFGLRTAAARRLKRRLKETVGPRLVSKVRITEIIPGRKFEAMRRNVDDAQTIMAMFGNRMVQESKSSFRRQRRGSFKWAKRLVPNVPGIIKDLNAGRKPPAKRFKARPALIDTGKLRDSISFAITGKNEVRIGSPLKYAAIHQRGGLSKATLTKSGRARLSTFLKTGRGKANKGLGFLFSKPSISVKVRKRPYILITNKDRKQFRLMLTKQIDKLRPSVL